jgi:alpha/beta superfamily hydrolase
MVLPEYRTALHSHGFALNCTIGSIQLIRSISRRQQRGSFGEIDSRRRIEGGMIVTTSSPKPHPEAARTPRLRSVDLEGPAGRLEAVVNEGSPGARFAAVVCHPHPLGGGTMHNKVVYHAMKALNSTDGGLGFPVLRFNFRGTGLSQGVHNGEDEADDVVAALLWLENEYKLPLAAAGFSFGAAMTLAACCAKTATRGIDIRALIALGLPIHSETQSYDYPFLADCAIPKLFISGDRDQYASPSELSQVVANAAEPKELVFIPGADHFFTRQLEPMQSCLTSWLKEQFR